MLLLFTINYSKSRIDLLLLNFSLLNFFFRLWTNILEVIHHLYFLFEGGHLNVYLNFFFFELSLIKRLGGCCLRFKFADLMFQSSVIVSLRLIFTILFNFQFSSCFILFLNYFDPILKFFNHFLPLILFFFFDIFGTL